MNKLKYLLTSLSMVICILAFTGTTAKAIVGGSYDYEASSPFVRVEMTKLYAPGVATIGNCSGTVIAPTWVLTAEHCVAHFDRPSYTPDQLRVVVADVDGASLSYNVTRIVLWDKYDNDLALLETGEVLKGVQVVKYGAVPDDSTWTYRLYGYGITESFPSTFFERPSSSKVLKFLDVSLTKNSKNYMFVSSPEGSGCHGDSGGAPLDGKCASQSN